MEIYKYICSKFLLRPLELSDEVDETDFTNHFKELRENNILIFNKKINNFRIHNNKIKTKLNGNLIFSLKIKDYNYKNIYLENETIKIKAKKKNNNWVFPSINKSNILPNINFYLVIELNNTIEFDIDIAFLLVSDEVINNFHNYRYNNVYFDKNKKLRHKSDNYKDLCYLNYENK